MPLLDVQALIAEGEDLPVSLSKELSVSLWFLSCMMRQFSRLLSLLVYNEETKALTLERHCRLTCIFKIFFEVNFFKVTVGLLVNFGHDNV